MLKIEWIYFILLIILFAFNPAFSSQNAKSNKETIKAHKNTKSKSITLQVMTKYSESLGVKAIFEKTDIKKTLGLNKKSYGELNYSAGKILVNTTTDDKKSSLLFDGKKAWIVEYPDLDFDPKGHRKVTIIEDHKPALAAQLIKLFSSPKEFVQKFKVLNQDNIGKMLIVEFATDDKSIKNFKIEFNTSKNLISSIEFTDDVQTVTKIEFKQTVFLDKIESGLFTFKPEKNDEVF